MTSTRLCNASAKTERLFYQFTHMPGRQPGSTQTQPYTGIDAVGIVREITFMDNSFSLVAAQTIAGVVAPATITIHVFLIASAQMPHPSKHLPVTNDIVCVFGELFSVEFDEPLGRNLKLSKGNYCTHDTVAFILSHYLPSFRIYCTLM
jgi:hypothetical protein